MTTNLIKTTTKATTTDTDIDPDLYPDADLEEDLEIITELDISHLTIEDDTPVDSFQSEEQQRFLVEPLYSAKVLSPPFLAAANVGLFYLLNGDPIVPDVLLSLGVQRPADYSQRHNRSYFVWQFGKVPDVCIEIVSNQEGDELTVSRRSKKKGKTLSKKDIYAQIGVHYYVVFDPLQSIQGEQEMNGALLRVWYISPDGYIELTPPEGITTVDQFVWLSGVGLGLTLWEGLFEEDVPRLWLRWCDENGQVIPTGAEGQEQERQRAEQAEQEVEQERQRAKQAEQEVEQERQRAEQAEQEVEQERQRAKRLAELLRQQGIDPDVLL